LSTIFRTNARLSTKGIYLSYQNWLGKLTEAEKVKFEKWSASRQSSSLNGFEFIKWKDLQAGDLVNWRSIDEDAVGHILMFVSWIDKSEKNPIFIGIDFNTFDAYLDGPSVRSFPVNINRPNIASSFLRKL